MTILKDR